MLWKLMIIIFIDVLVFVDFCGAVGDEHDFGGPGLCIELSLTLLLSRDEKLFDVLIMMESNRLDEKLGMPQFVQCHEILLSDMYTGVDICIQSA